MRWVIASAAALAGCVTVPPERPTAEIYEEAVTVSRFAFVCIGLDRGRFDLQLEPLLIRLEPELSRTQADSIRTRIDEEMSVTDFARCPNSEEITSARARLQRLRAELQARAAALPQ